MEKRQRIYNAILGEHLSNYRQMAFVSGPRQVGKTTTCRQRGTAYLDWDNEDHRAIILSGPGAVAKYAGTDIIATDSPILILDELHKYSKWKLFLKGFFDTYEDRVRVVVTGSSRLDVYRQGGDSLMGRYFLFRMHPFSVAELLYSDFSCPLLFRAPQEIPLVDWQALWEHGGYPEPFLRRDLRFSRRWRDLRQNQLLKEDVRDLTRIHELDQLAMLGRLLAQRSGCQLIYSTLARTIRVSENTIRSWIGALCSLHYGFLIRPWHRNVNKALRKEPKWFLYDWSGVTNDGARAETMVACHLLKAVQGWTNLGLGDFELYTIRDRQKREIDFLVVQDDNPWFIVEVKSSDTDLSPNLSYFQQQTDCEHAFQVVMGLDFVDRDCFAYRQPVVVPAKTLLSQLL